MIIADEPDLDMTLVPNREKCFTVPFIEIAKKIGDQLFSNIVAVGSLAALFGVSQDLAQKYLNHKFGKKGQDIVQKNIDAFKQGYEAGLKLPSTCQGACELDTHKDVDKEILFPGSTAIGIGAIAGGCNFISAYPMSPSTGVLTFLAQQADDFGIMVDQAEDEIAGINKCVAASYTGARAIASSSGGGFALMTEGVSLTAMTECPLVIHIAQRPGPATGLPTRTAQEDLNLALYAGHGEFPRMIFAPGTLEQGVALTQKAFNLADKYQIPIFILTDQYYVDTYYNIPNIDATKFKNEKFVVKTTKDYVRYKLTDTGISPRGVPGYGEGLVRVDSDEHNERAQITEDMENIRPQMTQKRLMKKLTSMMADVEAPSLVGPTNAQTYVICWGSNYHPVLEAIQKLNRKDVAMVHFHQVYPLHPKTQAILTKAKRILILENNATGQFADVLKLRANVDIPESNRYLKYSGEPFSVEDVVTFLQKYIS